MSSRLQNQPLPISVASELRVRPFRGEFSNGARALQRLHGLDYLRAGAAILVVLLHAAMPYMAHPLPTMRWAVTETTRSESIDYIGWGINSFIMPLFFLLSGFLTSQNSDRRTAGELLVSRGKRLGAAFAIGCVLILPLVLYAWLVGLVVQGELPIAKLRSLKIEGQLRQDLSGFAHLWYLQCLAALTFFAAILKHISPIRSRDVPLSWTLFIAAVGSVIALRLEPEILLGFKNQWFPSPLKVLFYAGFFAIGWRFAKSDESWRRGAWPVALSAAALLLFACLLPEVQQHVAAPEGGSRLTLLVICYVLVGGAGAMGVFARCAGGFHRPPNAAIRYVASASLWIYLFHHPVVAITQVDFLQVAIPAELKGLIAFILGVVLPLLTYRVLIERTFLGRWLDGAAPASRPVHANAPTIRRAA